MKSFISYKNQQGEYCCHLSTDEAAEAGEVRLPQHVGGAGGCVVPGHDTGAFYFSLSFFIFQVSYDEHVIFQSGSFKKKFVPCFCKEK